jgi:hypothetical protein
MQHPMQVRALAYERLCKALMGNIAPLQQVVSDVQSMAEQRGIVEQRFTISSWIADEVREVNRSGRQTMGMFLCVNGWSENVPDLLKQNPTKCIFLMDGYDLRCVLALEADLTDLLLAKVAHPNLKREPFLSVREFLDESKYGAA